MSEFPLNLSLTTKDIGPENQTHPPFYRRREEQFPWDIAIGVYSVIFALALVGNILVILTLVQNKRMRTVTNVFLLNLSFSDLLLAVFCMPFTLIPMMMQNFIFGEAMCVMIRYLQGVSVGVSCFTLVSISLERYFAICQPLHSRRWQTLSHSYKIIGLCWVLSGIIMIPIAVFTKHTTLRSGLHRCREDWNNKRLEMAYTVFLDVALLLVPLCIMAGAYVQIVRTLLAGITMGEQMDNTFSNRCGQTKKLMCELTSLRKTSVRSYVIPNGSSIPTNHCTSNKTRSNPEGSLSDSPCSSQESTPRRKMDKTEFIRQSNFEKSRTSKLRVIRMLFVVVVEFFICWTPLYVVNTWRSFDTSGDKAISNLAMALIFLLSYLSSCCNPITYCFMNASFRQSFLAAIQCCLRGRQDLGRYPSLNSKTSYRTSVHRMTFYERCNDNLDQCDKSMDNGEE